MMHVGVMAESPTSPDPNLVTSHRHLLPSASFPAARGPSPSAVVGAVLVRVRHQQVHLREHAPHHDVQTVVRDLSTSRTPSSAIYAQYDDDLAHGTYGRIGGLHTTAVTDDVEGSELCTAVGVHVEPGAIRGYLSALRPRCERCRSAGGGGGGGGGGGAVMRRACCSCVM
jgi:hypothetical protein